MLKRLLTLLFYGSLVLAAFGVCLVLLFPRDKFLVWVSDFVEQQLPGIEISAADVKYVHPFKVRLYELNVRDERGNWELPVDTLLLSLEPRWPIDRIGVIGVMFGGDFSFDLSLANKDRLELVGLTVSELHLRDLQVAQRAMDRPVEGIISLLGKASVERRTLIDLRFAGKLRLEKFQTVLREPVLEQTEVRFDKVAADVVMNGTVVDVTKGTASGPLLGGDFFGQVRTALPLSGSGIDFSGSLVPEPALVEKNPALTESLGAYFKRFGRQSIAYRIEGSVSDPLFSFENLD